MSRRVRVDEQGGTGMAHVMESDAFRKPGGHQRRLEVATVEVVVAKRSAARRREHEVLRLMGTAGKVRAQLLSQGAEEGHASALEGLGRTVDKAVSGHLCHALGDVDPLRGRRQSAGTAWMVEGSTPCQGYGVRRLGDFRRQRDCAPGSPNCRCES